MKSIIKILIIQREKTPNQLKNKIIDLYIFAK